MKAVVIINTSVLFDMIEYHI